MANRRTASSQTEQGIPMWLTPADEARIQPIIERRQALSRSDKTVEKGVVSPSEYMDIIRLGVMGEWAVASFLHGDIWDSADLIGEKADVIAPDGSTIEVKTTRRRGLNFILYGMDPEKFQGDYGILCWPHEKGIELIGWITRDEWLANYEVRNLRIPTLLYPWREMESMWLFPSLTLGAS